MDDLKIKSLGVYLHNALLFGWMHSNSEKPDIEIPEKSLIGKYARRVLYYVSGWTLHSMSKAKTIAKSQRRICTQFAEMHSLSEDEAKEQGLPIGLVQRRNQRADMFCSENYYNFIGDVIESTHVANPTLDMMMAYADRDIICAIKEQILKSDVVKNKFAALCST